MTAVIRRSHAYRDGSMVAECGYPRRPREPMDARKPTCPVCLKIERMRSQLREAAEENERLKAQLMAYSKTAQQRDELLRESVALKQLAEALETLERAIYEALAVSGNPRGRAREILEAAILASADRGR